MSEAAKRCLQLCCGIRRRLALLAERLEEFPEDSRDGSTAVNERAQSRRQDGRVVLRREPVGESPGDVTEVVEAMGFEEGTLGRRKVEVFANRASPANRKLVRVSNITPN